MKHAISGIVFAIVCLASTAAAAPRVAIVTEAPELSAAVDYLTVALSKEPSLALLERTEVDRVYREQGLTAAARDYLKLGQVLGADGLLLLEAGEGVDAGTMTLRLVAVGPGVVIADISSPWPVEDAVKWADGLAQRVAALAPKLTVRANEAIPLSLVNLHSALHNAEASDAERRLSLLAGERLARQPELFVLERRRMELLSAEKQLAGVKESAFWDGSYLLEGVLDRDGYSPTTITLHARLMPPKGGAPIEIDLNGSRTNLPNVADQLAQKILVALKIRPADTAWNAVEESQRYFTEAQWAFRWGLLGEAASDCESSWALGMETREVAELRIRSYFMDGIDESQASLNLDTKSVSFAPATRPHPGEFVMPETPSFAAGFAPDPLKFLHLRRAMELYADGFRRFVVSDSNPGWVWHDLGLDLLENASYWLMHYYYLPESRAGQENNIAAVRDLAREFTKLLGSHPALTNDFHRSDRPRAYKFHTRYHDFFEDDFEVRFCVSAAKATRGGYWCATPEEGLDNYRDLLAGGYFPRLRGFFLQPDFTERTGVDPLSPSSRTTGGGLDAKPLSYLAGWTWETRRRATSVWHGFIDELCAATNPAVRVEGLYMRCAQALTNEDHDRAFAQLLEFVANVPPPIVDNKLMGDIDALLGTKPRMGFRQAALDSRKQAWARVKQQLTDAAALRARDAEIQLRLNYLAAGDYNFSRFAGLFPQFDCSSNEAQILLPAFVAYRSNIAALKVKAAEAAEAARREAFGSARFFETQRHSSDLQSSDYWLASFQEKLLFRLTNSGPLPPLVVSNFSIGPPNPRGSGISRRVGPPPFAQGGAGVTRSNVPPYSPPMAGPSPFARGGMPGGFGPGPMGRVRQGADPARLSLSNVLEATRFWPFPTSMPGIEQPVQLEIANCFYREGRLWVDTRYARLGTFAGQESFINRGVVLALDLETFQSEVITLDPAETRLPDRVERRGERMFDVHGGFLYVSSENAIRRYSLQQKTWETLPVPIQGHGRICVVGDRLLLATEDSILEVDGAEARILASTRRRPARSLLDSLGTFHMPPMVEGPGGALRTVIGGNIYELGKGASDWSPLPTPDAVKLGSCAAFVDGLLLVSAPYQTGSGAMRQMVGLRTSASTPVLLLAQEPDRTYSGLPPGLQRPAELPAGSPGPQWPLPMGVYALNYPACLDGESLWVFAGELPAHLNGAFFAWDEALERHAVLFGLVPGRTNALAIPLKLTKPAVKLGASIMGVASSSFIFEPTPAGLVVARSIVPGLWVIPRGEIERRRKAWLEDGK